MRDEDRFYALLRKLTDNTVADLHEAMRTALAADDASAAGAKKYGMREYADFRAESIALERVLRERQLPFTPIRW